jgi:hypothetical protein
MLSNKEMFDRKWGISSLQSHTAADPSSPSPMLVMASLLIYHSFQNIDQQMKSYRMNSKSFEIFLLDSESFSMHG